MSGGSMGQQPADLSEKVESGGSKHSPDTDGDSKHSPDTDGDSAAPSPKLDPKGDLGPPPASMAPGSAGDHHEPVTSTGDLARDAASSASASAAATEAPAAESNAHISPSPVVAPSPKSALDSVRDVLGKFGKKVVEATKQTEELAGNLWQHLKTGPSIADAAMGVIAQGTKVIAEGGYEKIFRQTFDTLPEEQLKNSYACYLSTSAGPVMGILYLSSAKLAFCSDNPLSYKVGDQTEWSYYKVVIPLHQLRQVNPSASKVNRAEKYVQIVSVDNHEFWFMGFVNYDSAVKHLQEALQGSSLQH